MLKSAVLILLAAAAYACDDLKLADGEVRKRRTETTPPTFVL